MKKKNVNVMLMLLFSVLLLGSCKKDEIKANDSSDNPGHVRTGEDEHDPAGIESEELEDNPETPLTVGVTVVDGILEFDDMDAFESVIGSLVNQPDEKLNDWESDLGFTSMRSTNEMTLELDALSETPSIDHEVFDDGRIQDPAFETVLNADNKVIIGGEGYTFDYTDMSDRIMTVWDKDDPTTVIGVENLSTAGAGGGGIYVGEKNKVTKVIKEFDNNRRIVGRKGCEYWAIYASVYMSIRHQKKVWWGWKNVKQHIGVNLDQWASVEFEILSTTTIPHNRQCYTNVKKVRNEKKVRHTFDFAVNSGWYGVIQFMRVHHWKINEGYNNDVHNEAW